MLGGQLMLPSASDSSTNVSQYVCMWPPQQISFSCLVSSHFKMPDDMACTQPLNSNGTDKGIVHLMVAITALCFAPFENCIAWSHMNHGGLRQTMSKLCQSMLSRAHTAERMRVEYLVGVFDGN